MDERHYNPVDDVDFEWLEQVIRAAGEIALRHFRHVTPERKPDNTPVTVADRQIEESLRDTLGQRFPEDGLVGEEMKTHSGRSGRVWVIDPIDGTAAYAGGLPVWGISVGILQGWQSVAGVFYMPLIDEFYLCDGQRALLNGDPIQVDTSGDVDANSFLCITAEAHRDYSIDFVGKARAFGSMAAHICYVARGTAVAALVGRVALWDIAGALPLLRLAGGDMSSLSGQPLDLATMTGVGKLPEPLLAGAPWALSYFRERITERRSLA